MNKSKQIRSEFTEFFKERGHTVVRSAPVVPADDPTLLFSNAGMNQFKDIFLELGTRPYSRAVDTQKCIRVSGKHNDLEIVGKSPNHHTFFEMLGNWSFGDYYKREAIQWAWELLTNVWKLDPDRLHATVFEGNEEAPRDDEAVRFWLEEVGLPKNQLSYHDRKDNFWEMGDVGPCGPCSEIHYDLGKNHCTMKDVNGHICAVNGDCGRFIELWNLVFIQYRRDDDDKLHPLPRKHVDTGAGFERILRVLEGVDSNYDTSIFKPLLSNIADLSGIDYDPGDSGIPHRVAADHIRTLAFSIADGVLPSNEGRGYVIRRILRRAARYGREIGLETPYLFKLVDPLVELMGEAFPEIKDRYQHVTGVIRAEEESFARTLGRGLEIFGTVTERMKQENSTVIPGEDAFKLYDTYGFPLDLTQLMARERNLTVDINAFNQLMNKQREQARGVDRFAGSGELGSLHESSFLGYDQTETDARIVEVKRSKKTVDIILDKTPFYAESGGQEADFGTIKTTGGILEVQSVSKSGSSIIHHGKWKGDQLPQAGETANATIDWERRLPIMYNHTATHLFHAALRRHIGDHATQAGSLVAPDRLRFDFTHFEKLTAEQLEQIERTVNEAIRADFPVWSEEKNYQDAIDGGVTALFGEKYGDTVRVVNVGGNDKQECFSRELCGGTHVDRTGQIGMFRIIYEGAVSAGVRRIEAVTGEYAWNLMNEERKSLEQIRELLGSHGSDPVLKLEKALEASKLLERELKSMLEGWAKTEAKSLIENAQEYENVKIITKSYPATDIERLKLLGDAVRDSEKYAVALFTSPSAAGAGQLCCVVSDMLIKERKLKAGPLISQAARLAGGGGGGKPHMATAGAKHADKLDEAINGFFEIVKKAMSE